MRSGLALGVFALGALAGVAHAADPAAGRVTYDQLCATCHGPNGGGDGPSSAQFATVPRDFRVGMFKFDADSDGTTGSDADLRLVIRDGAGVYGGNPLMTPWPMLSDEQLGDLIAFVRSLAQPPQ